MRKLLLSAAMCTSLAGFGQITITANDMPVAGDSLRYSSVSILGSNLNLSNTGANISWDFSTLNPIGQGLDEYRSAVQINPLYALTIAPNAYGYKVADSFGVNGFSLPVSITNVYTFFSKKNNPSRFVAEAFAANIAGFPTPINYSDEDEWYFFPLQYDQKDTSTFRLSFSLPSIGSLTQVGTRTTFVDGWGTIRTPYLSTPTPCLRVRSEINEIDTIQFGTTNLPLPRRTVDYKWLVNGEHYPALWVTATIVGNNETVSVIRFRDQYRPSLSVFQLLKAPGEIKVFPNPATNVLRLTIPDSWSAGWTVEVFDVAGTLVHTAFSKDAIDVESWASGSYFVRASGGGELRYARFTK